MKIDQFFERLMRGKLKLLEFEYEGRYKKGLIGTKADTLSQFLTFGESIQAINEDISSYYLSVPQAKGTAIPKAYVNGAREVHVLDQTMMCDRQETLDSVAYNDNGLLDNTDAMLKDSLTSDVILMVTSVATDGAA